MSIVVDWTQSSAHYYGCLVSDALIHLVNAAITTTAATTINGFIVGTRFACDCSECVGGGGDDNE